jgi:hypothetical protein
VKSLSRECLKKSTVYGPVILRVQVTSGGRILAVEGFAVNNNATQETITRRAALGFGASLIVPLMGRASTSSGGKIVDLDLFVFRSPITDRLVMAVVCSGDSNPAKVCIHADKRNWTIEGGRFMRNGATSMRGEDRLFHGKVLSERSRTGEIRNAVVVETPFNTLQMRKSIDVWAEAWTANGSRARVGSPLVTKALALDPVLTRIYQSARPENDRHVVGTAFASRLSAIAATNGAVTDHAAHGQRLAALLLPDVIKYRPELPVGFTFASQNGRHPADETAAVIETILTGTPALCAAPNAFPVVEQFPYFQLPEIS